MITRVCLASLVLAVLSLACSASPHVSSGAGSDASVAGTGGAAGVGGFAGVGGYGGSAGNGALTALITAPPSAIAIEVVTIGCAGECKQVLAVASGGHAPYSFRWSDGVTSASRELCADDDGTLRVSVTDTAIVDGEFPYDAHTTSASVRTHVLVCPDGGVDAGVHVDASAELADASGPVDCSPDLQNDPTCDTLVRGADCPGVVMYDLPHPVEAGHTLCLELYANPSVSLYAEIRGGTGCTLSTIAATSPLNFGSAWGWLTCFPSQNRIERVGLTGLDPSVINYVRHCPNCGL